jgi:hypothetical protein
MRRNKLKFNWTKKRFGVVRAKQVGMTLVWSWNKERIVAVGFVRAIEARHSGERARGMDWHGVCLLKQNDSLNNNEIMTSWRRHFVRGSI